MSKKIEKEFVTWPTYLRLINELAETIDWKKEGFKSIVAINRGGNIPGVLCSHKINIPLQVWQKNVVLNVRGKILIIDDISDSGNTLSDVINQLGCKQYKTATLHRKVGGNLLYPDYFVESTDKWIVYPYETL